MRGFLILFAGLLLTMNVEAETLVGRVAGVTDGDTVTLLDGGKNEVKIRLAAIDAPEKAMPFGQKSKEALSDLCFDKPASVEVVDTDRYGRTVGVITCAGVKANDAMVRSGMAWVYTKYAKGFGHLYPLEESARASKQGLWADSNPIPPWEWRHRGRK